MLKIAFQAVRKKTQYILIKIPIKQFSESLSKIHGIQRLNYIADAYSNMSWEPQNSLQQNKEMKFNNLYSFKVKSKNIFRPSLDIRDGKDTT